MGDRAAVNVDPPRRPLEWPWLAAMFALALALRAVHVAQYEARHPLADRPVIDEASYDRWAREIAGGELVGDGIFFQEPLYPYVLGVVYACAGDDARSQRRAARYVQAALGAATAALVAVLAARLAGRNAGIVAGFAMALHRPAIWFPSLLLKENLFLLVVVSLALALVRARDLEDAPRGPRLRAWLAAGSIAGAGALLRGNLLVLLPFLALWPLAAGLRREAFAAGASVALGAALALLPVAARNLAVGGRFVLTTSGAGTNFYGGNNLDNPHGVATEFEFVRTVPEHEQGDWRHEAGRRLGRELDAAQVSSFWMGEALRSMRAHPLEHAAILWRKLRATLGRYEVPDNHFIEWDGRYVPLLRCPWPGFEITGWLGLAGALTAALAVVRRRAARGTGDVLALGALYLATVVATVTSERIRLALVPLLAVLAGAFVAGWFRRPAGGLRWVERTLALAVSAAFVFVPSLPEHKRAADLDERDYNLAAGWISEGAHERAAPIVSELFARHPESDRVGLLAADLDLARAARALDANPGGAPISREVGERIWVALDRLDRIARRGNAQERFRAHVLLGAMAQRFGRFADAEREYRAALDFDPSDPDLRRRLAVAIAEQAMLASPGPERRARLAEALALLDALLADERSSNPEVAALRDKVRSEL